jgi:hypothetical protein
VTQKIKAAIAMTFNMPATKALFDENAIKAVFE